MAGGAGVVGSLIYAPPVLLGVAAGVFVLMSYSVHGSPRDCSYAIAARRASSTTRPARATPPSSWETPDPFSERAARWAAGFWDERLKWVYTLVSREHAAYPETKIGWLTLRAQPRSCSGRRTC